MEGTLDAVAMDLAAHRQVSTQVWAVRVKDVHLLAVAATVHRELLAGH